MLRIGFIGWRGMVGSVLMERMRANNDFKKMEAVFFSTSNLGGVAPQVGQKQEFLLNAYEINDLLDLDCIVTMQGSEYTNEVMPKLKAGNYSGFFIDASSALRMAEDSLLILDPINYDQIIEGIKSGTKIFSGANCTVSLMLLAISGLIKHDLVEWVSSQTYQAASGAGANHMRELLVQFGELYNEVADDLAYKNSNVLELEHKISHKLRSNTLSTQNFGAPLAGNVLPWIDSLLDNGQTKEEWKGQIEANKILGRGTNSIKIDGNCVRVGSMRSHSQALTLKLKDSKISIAQIEEIIKSGNEWIRFVDNNKADTLRYLTPVSVNGTLDVAIGRVRKSSLGEEYLSAFTVGDQLLWGAAEPIRRMINILVDTHK